MESFGVTDESVLTMRMPKKARPEIMACQLKPGTEVRVHVQHQNKEVKATIVRNPLSLDREDEASLVGINFLSKFEQANGHPYGISDDSMTFVDRACIIDDGRNVAPSTSTPSTSTALTIANPVLPSRMKVLWKLADGTVEDWPVVTHEKSIYEFVKVKLDSAGEIECDAGSELWKHQQYIKSIEQPGTSRAVALPSAAAAPAGSSKALRKRKVCESPMYQALEQAKKLVNILEAVQEQQTLSDRQRQPILTQCQIIMQTVSEPGIKTEAAE